MRNQLAKIIYNIYHNDVIKVENDISKLEYLRKSEIESYQLTKLNLLLEYAYTNIPYYRNILNNIGIGNKGINTLDELKKFPITRKEDLRNNYSLFISEKPVTYSIGSTSGSTGEPLVYRKSYNSNVIEMALVLRFEKNMGIKIGDSKLLIWGGIEMDPYKKLKRYIKNYIYNYDYYNNYNVNLKKLSKLVDKLYKKHYVYYRSYPSTMAIIANEINNRNEEFNNYPKAISVSVETLMKSDRAIIEKVFGKILYDQYGCGEVNSIAFECSEHQGLHHAFEHSIIEVLDDNDNDSKSGRLIITNLDNYAMPLIRYENGDIITLAEYECTCGRESMLISEIQGRIFDKIVGTNGKIVHGGFFDDLILKSNAEINKWQIVQSDIDCLKLYYISKNDISFSSKNYIEHYIKKQLGSDTKVIFEKKDYLMPEENGKYKFVKSMLSL